MPSAAKSGVLAGQALGGVYIRGNSGAYRSFANTNYLIVLSSVQNPNAREKQEALILFCSLWTMPLLDTYTCYLLPPKPT